MPLARDCMWPGAVETRRFGMLMAPGKLDCVDACLPCPVNITVMCQPSPRSAPTPGAVSACVHMCAGVCVCACMRVRARSPRRSTPRHPVDMASTTNPPHSMPCALAAALLPGSRAHGCRVQKTLFPGPALYEHRSLPAFLGLSHAPHPAHWTCRCDPR